jgi:putative transposase
VWITKNREKILTGDVALKLREIIRKICVSESVEIIRGLVSSDHVHLFVSITPKVVVSRLIQKLKERTSRKLTMTFPSLQKLYWGRHMWARGYFCCGSGNITDEIIKNYIENHHDSDEDFKID